MYAVYLKKHEPSAQIKTIYTCASEQEAKDEVFLASSFAGEYAKIWHEEVPALAQMSPYRDGN